MPVKYCFSNKPTYLQMPGRKTAPAWSAGWSCENKLHRGAFQLSEVQCPFEPDIPQRFAAPEALGGVC